MQTHYYISKDDKDLGPWDPKEIVERLNSGEIAVTDYAFDESKQDWVLLLECEPINSLLKNKKPTKAPAKAKKGLAEDDEDMTPFNEKTVIAEAKATPNNQSDEWFILKWDNRYGPFTYPDIIKMLQEKSVFEFDYVWKAGMESWARVAEREEFSPGAIKSLILSGDSSTDDIFFRRRHMRTAYNGSIIVHDNSRVWKGESLEMSEAGAGIVMNNAMLLPGQTVYLHFKPGDRVPPFNAVCEIVNKKYVKGVKDRGASLNYGVKFVNITQDARKAIKNFTQKEVA